MDNLTIQTQLRMLGGVGGLGGKPELPIVDDLSSMQPGAAGQTPGETTGASFKDLLTQSIDKVNQTMLDSDQAVQALATGQSSDLHGALIAMQKADISFRLLVEVRNKVLSAYDEIMRTQT